MEELSDPKGCQAVVAPASCRRYFIPDAAKPAAGCHTQEIVLGIHSTSPNARAGRRDQIVKQRSRQGSRAFFPDAIESRDPVRIVGPLNGLDHPIGSAGLMCRPRPRSRSAYDATNLFPQRGAGQGEYTPHPNIRNMHRIRRFGAVRKLILGGTVANLVPISVGYPEPIAAQKNVERLDAIADRQHRLARCQRMLEQSEMSCLCEASEVWSPDGAPHRSARDRCPLDCPASRHCVQFCRFALQGVRTGRKRKQDSSAARRFHGTQVLIDFRSMGSLPLQRRYATVRQREGGETLAGR